tara:strand:+ start:61225 stop:62820 length:1596 start_codon:yes stop_codon:yes gene_type:complete
MNLRTNTYFLTALLAASLLPALACDGEVIDAGGDTVVAPLPLDQSFDDAARETGVPTQLLKAIAQTETQFQMVRGDEHHGRAGSVGLMGLRSDVVAHAAKLASLDVMDVEQDPASNILAAAFVLSELADARNIDRADLGAWAETIGDYSTILDDEARYAYVVGGVYETLNTGAEFIEEDGTPIVSLAPISIEAQYPAVTGALFAGTSDYSDSVWRPSPNFSNRPTGSVGKPKLVVIHTCEGGYAGCWGWLRNTAASASAHYVVKENGSQITQLVREAKRAWHISASYSSARNGGTYSSLNGRSTNDFSIGIEHAGYASQSSFPSGQINASAKLVCDITKDHSIARDKYHIVGHGQLQPWNRTDPGANWPWTHYINRVKEYCGTGGGGDSTDESIVVDSNNSRNDAAKARIEVSSNWSASNSVSGYFGTGYWFAETAPVSDGASFWFYMPQAGTRTVDAWWPAANDRSRNAKFVAFNAAGTKLGTSSKNQQAGGNRWNELGSYSFSSGWNRVVLSRWTIDSNVVVADAIRIR